MDDLISLALLALGIYVTYKIVTKIGGWLLKWARRAIRGLGTGVGQGLLAIARKAGEIWAFAVAQQYGNVDVVEEIEVDEGDLSQDVLDALRRHGAVVEKIHI